MRQQNLTVKGWDDVPDGLLFADAGAKAEAKADRSLKEWKRYGFGLAIVESKCRRRPLDRRSGRQGEKLAPSTQMLRYIRRVDDLTEGRLRLGHSHQQRPVSAIFLRCAVRLRAVLRDRSRCHPWHRRP